MSDTIPRFQRPELFFGFVAPIGSSLTDSLESFRSYLRAAGYQVEDVHVTDVYRHFRESVPPTIPLEHKRTKERYSTHIQYGNQLREHFHDDSILAATSIVRLQRKRLRKRDVSIEPYQGVAYLIHQLKRKEEIALLRTVYGPNFFQVSVYSRRAARVEHLAKSFAESQHSLSYDSFQSDADNIVRQDENENQAHGQQVGQIFHEADFIINLDNPTSVEGQVNRFCDLIFGSNSRSPTHMEYGMFLAKAAALRTLDLSRQVGVAIFGETGELERFRA